MTSVREKTSLSIISLKSQWEQMIPDQPRTKEPNYEQLLGISFFLLFCKKIHRMYRAIVAATVLYV